MIIIQNKTYKHPQEKERLKALEHQQACENGKPRKITLSRKETKNDVQVNNVLVSGWGGRGEGDDRREGLTMSHEHVWRRWFHQTALNY